VLNEPTLQAGSILRRGSLRAVIYDRLTRSLGKEPDTATPRDVYDALSLGVREELSAAGSRRNGACGARASSGFVICRWSFCPAGRC
jgi:hypothetical protein